MKYILFEASAAEVLVATKELQSSEYELCQNFIRYIRGDLEATKINGVDISKTSNGIMFVGKGTEKKFTVIDLEQSQLLNVTADEDLLLIMQKLLRFAIRYWNKQSFTSTENIVDDKAIIFPFPYRLRNEYRVVIAREPSCSRLQKRGISSSLLVYKYTDKRNAENPNTEIYQKAGEHYLSQIAEIIGRFNKLNSVNTQNGVNHDVLHRVETDKLDSSEGFMYLPLDKQIEALTEAQRDIVLHKDIQSPIRVEGPAGTGKTMSLIMRAAYLLRNSRLKGKGLKVAFFTHSKTTELRIKSIFDYITEGKWNNSIEQEIYFSTLQDYCADYIHLGKSQIIDGDAYEAKQYQLMMIQDIYYIASSQYFSTYRPHLSDGLKYFFDNEEESRIVAILQHEFSVQIKGYSEENFDIYKKLPALENGLPASNEMDKEYIFTIFQKYQDELKMQSVFDTDDVVLEAITRFRGPLWKRERKSSGFDYIFVDEMHLFNLNEQQAFHYLTKDGDQKTIPICFALDYSQAIGDHGAKHNNYFDKVLSKNTTISREYNTVFRSSQEIAEFCYSITASGAAMFINGFINPYKAAQSGFTLKEESFCMKPMLYMYNNDNNMVLSLKDHVDDMIKAFHCNASDIAIITFGKDLITHAELISNLGRPVTELISRNSYLDDEITTQKNAIVFSTPDNVNGLEFFGVILIGVDSGRVPITSAIDISNNFMRYKALSQLYLACSRAKYQVRILGNSTRGLSECLVYSLNNETLIKA